jgi:hypothetical protein
LKLPLRTVLAFLAVASVWALAAVNAAPAGCGRRRAPGTTAAAATATTTASAAAFGTALAPGKRVRVIQFDIRKWAAILIEDDDMRAVAPGRAVTAISSPAAQAAVAAMAAVPRLGIRLAPLTGAAAAAIAPLLALLALTPGSAISSMSPVAAAAIQGDFAENCLAMDQQIRGIAALIAALGRIPRESLRTLGAIAARTARERRIVAPRRAMRIQTQVTARGLRRRRVRTRPGRAIGAVVSVSSETAEVRHVEAPLS